MLVIGKSKKEFVCNQKKMAFIPSQTEGARAMANDKRMDYYSGEKVETDGIYANESGQETALKRGDEFPSDLILGKTTWELKGFSLQEGEIDHRSVQNTKPRAHVDRGDK
jgi:hypothetical protein